MLRGKRSSLKMKYKLLSRQLKEIKDIIQKHRDYIRNEMQEIKKEFQQGKITEESYRLNVAYWSGKIIALQDIEWHLEN